VVRAVNPLRDHTVERPSRARQPTLGSLQRSGVGCQDEPARSRAIERGEESLERRAPLIQREVHLTGAADRERHVEEH